MHAILHPNVQVEFGCDSQRIKHSLYDVSKTNDILEGHPRKSGRLNQFREQGQRATAKVHTNPKWYKSKHKINVNIWNRQMSRVKDGPQCKQTTVEKKEKQDTLSKFLLYLQTIRAYRSLI